MISRRKQRILKANWNRLAYTVNKNSNIRLQLLSETGSCDGLSKVWLSFQHQNRGEEFNDYFDFLTNLSDNDIINFISLIKQQNEGRFFNIALGKDKKSYPFRKLVDFLIAVNDTHKTQTKTKFKGSIAAHWDANFMVACYPDQLTEYLKKSQILQGNKLIYISTPKHAMALAKKKPDEYVFFDSNGQETPCKNEEELTQALLKSLSWIKADSIINLTFDEISYGDKNRELDDIFVNNKHLIDQDPYMKTLVLRYFNGHISRRDVAYSLHSYLSKEMNSTMYSDLINELDKYLQQHPKYSQIAEDLLNNQSNKIKQSPFLRACDKGNLELVINLLNRGANLNVVDWNGWTALMYAASRGHVAVVNALLSHGANPNVANEHGWTALMIAASKGHVEIVKALLSKGAYLNVVTENGWTALKLAKYKGHAAVVNALLSKEADLNVKIKRVDETHKKKVDFRVDQQIENLPSELQQAICSELGLPNLISMEANKNLLDIKEYKIHEDESYSKHFSARIDAINNGAAFLLDALPASHPFRHGEELKKYLTKIADECKNYLNTINQNDIHYYQNSLTNYVAYITKVLQSELDMNKPDVTQQLERAEEFALAKAERRTVCTITRLEGSQDEFVVMIDQPQNPFYKKIKEELFAIQNNRGQEPEWFSVLKEYEKNYIKKFLKDRNLEEELGSVINALSSKLRLIPVPSNYSKHTLITYTRSNGSVKPKIVAHPSQYRSSHAASRDIAKKSQRIRDTHAVRNLRKMVMDALVNKLNELAAAGIKPGDTIYIPILYQTLISPIRTPDYYLNHDKKIAVEQMQRELNESIKAMSKQYKVKINCEIFSTNHPLNYGKYVDPTTPSNDTGKRVKVLVEIAKKKSKLSRWIFSKNSLR